MGKGKKEKLKTKARAEKAKTKGGLHSWQQAKSLSEKNKGLTGVPPPGTEVLGILSPSGGPSSISSSSLPSFLLFTHYNWSRSSHSRAT